jgi:hypothetical protein
MQHLDPRQIEPIHSPQQSARRGARLWTVLFLAVALGAGWAGTRWFGVPGMDTVSASEAAERSARFASVQPLEMQAVPADKQAAAVQGMQLDAAAQLQLRRQLAPATTNTAQRPATAKPSEAPMKLVEIMLWDTHAPDGDVVTVESGGYAREVVLAKQPQTLVIPVDATASLKITGVRDGGGGITLGVGGPKQKVLMPILSEGQTLLLPLAR